MQCVTWKTQETHEDERKVLSSGRPRLNWSLILCGQGFIYMNSLKKLFTVPSGVSSRGCPRQKEGTRRRSGSLISTSTSRRLWGSDTTSTQTFITACNVSILGGINIPGVAITLREKKKKKSPTCIKMLQTHGSKMCWQADIPWLQTCCNSLKKSKKENS